ncbi:MAG: hypothetical protein AVDCRST_MAG30-2240, partial [uncultured Solirubrobacteraceae bacterium]
APARALRGPRRPGAAGLRGVPRCAPARGRARVRRVPAGAAVAARSALPGVRPARA